MFLFFFVSSFLQFFISDALQTFLPLNKLIYSDTSLCLLQVTMQDYRSEVKELFAADEQLAAEVEYNLKQFEKEKQQQEQQQQIENQLANFTMSPRQNVSQTYACIGK